MGYDQVTKYLEKRGFFAAIPKNFFQIFCHLIIYIKQLISLSKFCLMAKLLFRWNESHLLLFYPFFILIRVSYGKLPLAMFFKDSSQPPPGFPHSSMAPD